MAKILRNLHDEFLFLWIYATKLPNILRTHPIFLQFPQPLTLSWFATSPGSSQQLIPTPALAARSLPLSHLPLLCDFEQVTFHLKPLVSSVGDEAPVLDGP